MREISGGTLIRTLVLALFVGIVLPIALKHIQVVDSSYWWYVTIFTLWFPLAAMVLAWRDSVLYGTSWWWMIFPALIMVVTGMTQADFWSAIMVAWVAEMFCSGLIGTFFGGMYYNRRVTAAAAAKATDAEGTAQEKADQPDSAADSATAKSAADSAAEKPAAHPEQTSDNSADTTAEETK